MAHKVPDQRPNSPRLLQHTLGIVSGLSLLSSGAAVANPASTPVAGPQSATELLAPAPAAPSGSTASTDPGASASQKPSSPERVPASIPTETDAPADYGNVFIDSTDYSLGATESPDNPTLIFSERSSGCQVTVSQGQPLGTQCTGQASSSSAAGTTTQGNDGVRLGPVNISRQGVSVGNTTVISREAINRRIQPLNLLRRGQQSFVFPLSIPAPITSLFGWRVHPIFGDQRFHSGTDLAAPTGTPVLATQAGQVAVADAIGGYGLTVILRHGEGDLESRYAHLSRILVQPGEWIEQGDVVGLVGSTGNSTGPHLHFEMRQLTAQGWAVVDPSQVLQQSVAQLIDLIDNPLQALNRPADESSAESSASGPLPHRPAQPNAS
ncbi:Murein DD-endopeptidase MepM [Halomicronema hongdechloris C2206]|uniref:Murein DD-endopeptidase MepM n=1 Tax=Halomicronema hongdechloris C2206 TaxID=1641165 RepID=A0A1Z3HUN6_9CYAN|nr:M23 family metallopeptidase [Halomicronema hongdechloris]ASC74030.1 Murein DD-endopeptidase MepM [Halomicronema hongdechloris C2206]